MRTLLCLILLLSFRGLTAQFGPPVIIFDSLTRSADFELGDMDGDGDIDVVTGSATDSLLVCFLNNGQGLFLDSVHISHLPIYDGPGSIINELTLMDLDQDGDQDIIQCLVDQGDVHWYMNDGTGHFGPRTALLTIGSWTVFGDTADIDVDGLTDITLWTTGQIAWLRNTGANGFTLEIQPYQYALRNTTVDVDGDGDHDIVHLKASAIPEEELLTWTANNGAGVFGTPTLIATVAFGCSLGHADVDGDGDEDLLLTRCWASQQGLHVYLNDGFGAFTLGQTILPTVCLHDLATADMDGDGDPDLLVHNQLNTLYLPNNSGLFGPAQVVSSFTAPNPCWITIVATADINGDGFLDVVDSHHAAPGTYLPIRWYGYLPITDAISSVVNDAPFFAPNPMEDRARLVLPRTLDSRGGIELVDARGRVVRTLASNGSPEVVIERGLLDGGLYVLRVVAQDGSSTALRMVVQ
ncbi:MAG: T9SS type A sorting domain-containing protein [Flavobacteriales bacterium]|nr:T9SS type A sorting domain-containing protein [Flavobacteriales bacterium]